MVTMMTTTVLRWIEPRLHSFLNTKTIPRLEISANHSCEDFPQTRQVFPPSVHRAPFITGNTKKIEPWIIPIATRLPVVFVNCQ